jgi:hypothetical protein
MRVQDVRDKAEAEVAAGTIARNDNLSARVSLFTPQIPGDDLHCSASRRAPVNEQMR